MKRIIEIEKQPEPEEAIIEQEINIENIPEEKPVEEKVVRRIEKQIKETESYNPPIAVYEDAKGEEIPSEAIKLDKETEIIIPKTLREKPKKIGFLQKIKKAISEKELTEADIKDVLWDLQISLVQSDVAVEVAEKIVSDLKNNLVGKSVEKNKIDDIVKESLKNSVADIINVDEF